LFFFSQSNVLKKFLQGFFSKRGGCTADFYSFLTLAQFDLAQGNKAACEQIKSELVKRLLLERIHPSEELLKKYENLCGTRK